MNPRRPLRIPALTATLLMLGLSPVAQGYSWGLADARAMAMGGVGVVTGSQAASIHNPALLGYLDYEIDWSLLAPTVARYTADTGDLDADLRALRNSVATLDAAPTVDNASAVAERLLDLDGQARYRMDNAGVLLSIPSALVGGALFINRATWSGWRPVIGGDDLSDPNNPVYTSTLEYRGVQLLENGVSAASLLHDVPWLGSIAIGVSPKLVLMKGWGYAEDVTGATLTRDNARVSTHSDLTVDVGMTKEWGIWKFGVMVRNLLPISGQYGESGQRFTIGPDVRAGAAYLGRYTTIAADIDLTTQQQDPFGNPVRYAAIGIEQLLWTRLALRAGYRHDIEGGTGTVSAGLGFRLYGFGLDIAASHDEMGLGLGAQLVAAF